MITLDRSKVRKDTIKRVVIEGSCCYVYTTDFLKIGIGPEELLLIYKECPQVRDNDVFNKFRDMESK